jgi:uncharacterized protein (DUF302 family)
MSYGTSVTLDLPFADAVGRVRAALQEQGFGVLTEIDVTATLRARLGEQIEDYIILGACNPPAAHQALGIDRSIGLLLPCNVVVRATADGTLVEALDPQVMVTLTGQPELKPVADEVARRLASALAAITSLRRLAEACHGQQRSRRRRRRPSRQFPHHVRPGDQGRPSRPRRRPPAGPSRQPRHRRLVRRRNRHLGRPDRRRGTAAGRGPAQARGRVRHYPAARLRKVRPGTAKRSRSRAEPGCSGAGTALLGGDGGHDLIRMVATTTPGAFLAARAKDGAAHGFSFS